MPKQILKLLKDLQDNGTDHDLKVLGAGVMATLEAVIENQDTTIKLEKAITKHFNDKELHTPKGILVRGSVIAWFILLMFVVSTITMYIPELITWILSLP